ncbi:hypothetical protein ABBQ32_006166 [Trebouxia sp. C0010 RCD-2024]
MNPMILSQAAHTPRLDAFLPCKTHACHHAFSSGSVATTRRHARRCLIPRVNKQREGLVVCAAAATDVGAKAVQSIKKSVGGDVFVVGGDGQLAARIVQELLRNGFKVTAGVSDIKGARAGLDFAKRFEIIKGSETKNIRLQEVDLSDASAIAAALPRNARVLVAVGDSLGGQKADARLLDRALSAASEKGAQQFILVTPLGGGASAGGFLGNLFGGGGGSSKKPSKIEQQVSGSGLDFVIVRTAKSDGDAPLGDSGVAVTPQGSLTSSSKVTKSQVAEVVAQVLLQAQTDVLVEVAADPSSSPQGVESAVAEALPNCSIAEEEQQTAGGDDEEEPQEAPSPAKAGGPFGRTQAIKAKDGKDGASQESKGPSGGGLFGGRSKAAADAPTGPQKQKKISAKLVDAKPVGKEKGGFAQIRGSKQQPEEAEDDDDSAPQNPLSALFGGAKKAKAQAQQATPSVKGARKAASKGIAAKGRQGKSAVKQAGAAASGNGAGQPEKKKGGFLQALGLGQDSVYADDDK